jgi:hypothetical protein
MELDVVRKGQFVIIKLLKKKRRVFPSDYLSFGPRVQQM